jgi:hypothetical protein
MADNILAALAVGGFGLIVLALVIASLRDAAAMKRWPIARGRVVSSKVEEYHEIIKGHGSNSRGDRMTLYRPAVVYEYEVNGQRYESNRITQSPGLNRGVPDLAAEVVRRYPQGSSVDVRYNPRHLPESVLEPRVPRSWIFALAIAAGLLAMAVREYLR